MARFIANILLVLFFLRYSTAEDCQFGEFWDGDSGACALCSPCPDYYIESDFYEGLPCYQQGNPCPDWCHPFDADSWGNKEAACERNRNPPTTPIPEPFVNVTMTAPVYNESSNSYTMSCTMFYSDMRDVPALKWYSPSGEAIGASSGKWQVTEDEMSEEKVVQTLVIKEFVENDEGNYTCSAQSEGSANRTVFLEYVEPQPVPTSQSPTTTIPKTSAPAKETSSDLDKQSSPQGGIPNTVLYIVFAAFAFLVILICVIAAYFIRRNTCKSGSWAQVADSESFPLTGVDSIRLETTDSSFQSANVVGLWGCYDVQGSTVIIKQNNKDIWRGQESQNEVFIQHIRWNDSIDVWLKRHRKAKCIKELKMNCLKVDAVTPTSATIHCPYENNVFYCQIREKNHGDFQDVLPVQDGKRDVCDLRIETEYCVQLGVRGQTGDSGPYNWIWSDEFKTNGPTLEATTIKDTQATLQLNIHSVPSTLHYAVNRLDKSELNDREIRIDNLVPGMKQVVRLLTKETRGDMTEFRLLQEFSFTTQGVAKDFGDYDGDMTTDYEEFFPTEDEETRKHSKQSRAKRSHLERSRTMKSHQEQCTTSLREGLHNFRFSPKSKLYYIKPDPDATKAMMDCLIEFWKKRPENKSPSDSSIMSGKIGLDDIKHFVNETDMHYAAIFTVLNPFIDRDDVHCDAGVDFANRLLSTHNGPCRFCSQACFLIEWYTKKKNAKSS